MIVLHAHCVIITSLHQQHIQHMWHQIGNNRLKPKNRKEQLSSQCAQTFQVEADCLGKSDAYLHRERERDIYIYTYAYIYIWYDMQMIQSCGYPVIFRYNAASSQGGRPRVRSSYLGFRSFSHRLCWAPCRGWAMLGSKLRQGRLLFLLLLLLVAGLWCFEVFSGFFGSEGTLQDSSVALQLQLLQSTHGKPQPRIWLNNWWCNDEMWWDVMRCDEMWWDVMRCDEMWWDVMRCDEMWWGMPGLLDFLILFCSFRML